MPSRALPSQEQHLLAKPHVITAIGSRALRFAAPVHLFDIVCFIIIILLLYPYTLIIELFYVL